MSRTAARSGLPRPGVDHPRTQVGETERGAGLVAAPPPGEAPGGAPAGSDGVASGEVAARTRRDRELKGRADRRRGDLFLVE
jgi:hypothetical protein